MNIRDALAKKRQRETFYDLEVADPTEAKEQFEAARAALRLAKLRAGDGSPEAADAQAAVDEAREAWMACTYRVRFRNLEPDVYEALVAAHPPTKEQEAKGEQWNRATFAPALLSACAVDSDLSEEDWAAEFKSGRWPVADRDAAFLQALAANLEPRSATVPKG